jgi:hypothetical protein
MTWSWPEMPAAWGYALTTTSMILFWTLVIFGAIILVHHLGDRWPRSAHVEGRSQTCLPGSRGTGDVVVELDQRACEVVPLVGADQRRGHGTKLAVGVLRGTLEQAEAPV